MMMQEELTRIAPIVAAVRAAGGEVLVVGGAVRDMLRGMSPKDIDLEVYGVAADHLEAILARFGRVDAVGRAFGVLKVTGPGGIDLDIALPRRENKVGSGHKGFLVAPDPTMTPREAAARRDFTWNAMALTPEGEVLDFFGGADDLRAGIIRHTSPAFAEDPLRVLRAVQFAARFDMRLDPATAQLCADLRSEAHTLARERIAAEWSKCIEKGTHFRAALNALRDSGWLACYPELAALDGCPQDATHHPEGDVFTHTALVMEQAAAIAARDAVVGTERSTLVLAALCHDLGKPATTAHTADGRITSHGHAAAGETPTRTLLARMGGGQGVTSAVVALVREHMAHVGSEPTARTVRRLAVRLETTSIARWAQLVEADHSGRPPLAGGLPAAAAAIVGIAQADGVADGRPQPLLMGRDLIAMGRRAGPEFRAILDAAYAAQIDGAFATTEAAREWVQQQS